MTGEQKSFREKLGAVFFTFVMVTSMVAIGSVAFSGSAAAAAGDINNATVSSNPAEANTNNAEYVATIDVETISGGSNVEFNDGTSSDGVDFVEVSFANSPSIDFTGTTDGNTFVEFIQDDGSITQYTGGNIDTSSSDNSGTLRIESDQDGKNIPNDIDFIRVVVEDSITQSGLSQETATISYELTDDTTSDSVVTGSTSNVPLTLGSNAPVQLDAESAGDTSFTSFIDALNTAQGDSSTTQISVNGDVDEFFEQTEPLSGGVNTGTGQVDLTNSNDQGLTITGSGSPRVEVLFDDTGADVITTDRDDITISNLNVSVTDGPQIGNAPTGFLDAGAVSGLNVTNTSHAGYTGAGSTIAVDPTGSATIQETSILQTNAGNGIEISGQGSVSPGDTILISNNTIELESSEVGIEVKQMASSDGTLTIESVDEKPIVGGDNSETGVRFGDSGTVDADTIISGLNVTDTGSVGIEFANSNNFAGDITVVDTSFQGTENAFIDSNTISGAFNATNIRLERVGNSNDKAPINLDGLSGDIIVNGIVANDTRASVGNDGNGFLMKFDATGSPGTIEFNNISVTNTTSATTTEDILVIDANSGPSEILIDGFEVTNLDNNVIDSVGTSSLIDAGDVGSLAFSVDSVSITNTVIDDVQDSDLDFGIELDALASSNSDSLNIDTIDVNNTISVGTAIVDINGGAQATTISNAEIESVTDSTVFRFSGNENNRNTVSVDASNVTANATGTVFNVNAVDAANDQNTFTFDNIAVSNASSDAIILSDANIDVVNITGSIVDSDDRAVLVSSVASDATINSEIDVDNLNVAANTDAAFLIDNNAGRVNFDQSSFNNIGNGNSQDAIRVASGLAGTLNVNTTDFDPGNIDGAAINVDSLGGSSDINITETNFNNRTGTALITNDGDANVDTTLVWWGNVTGPNVVNANTVNDRFANGADIDDSNSNSYSITPWTNNPNPSGQAVFGFEGVVNDDGGSQLSNTEVTLNYAAQNQDIDNQFTFTTSGSGEYVAVISEHQTSDFYDVSANTQGFAESDTQQVTIDGSGTSGTFIASGTNLNLNSGAALEGFVNNASGEQLQSTGNLQLIDASNDEVLVDGFSTNASGGFTVSLTPDTYDLRVNHPNFDSSNTVEGVELQSGNTTTLPTNFTLREGTTADFTATVEFSNGTAIENTDVTFSGSGGVPSSNDASLPVTQTTDSSGIVQFEIPASDTNDAYTITADSANFSNASTGVATAPGDSVSRTFSLEEAQQQEPSVSVNFTDQTVPNGTEQVTVDSAEFTQADGSAGDYVVVVHTIDEFGAPVGEVSNPIGASGDLTGAEEDITVDLTAADGPIDSITENVTLRAMLHTTDDNSAFGTRLGSEDAAIDGIEPGDETDDANITVSEDIFVEPAPGTGADSPPQDPDGDGTFEDVNGDNQVNFEDVIDLAFAQPEADNLTDQQRDALDIDGDGDVDFDDVIELAFQL